MALSAADARTFERCIAVGGIAVFPADTVYGLACEPDSKEAVQRLYMLKRRAPDKPAAVMFFALDLALAALPELGPRTAARCARCCPAPSRCCCPTRPGASRSPAVRARPTSSGVRVPRGRRRWPRWPTSAGRCCSPARTWPAGPTPAGWRTCRSTCASTRDLVLDGGELPGTPSTVVDLRGYELDERWSVAREGAMSITEVAARLESAP